MPNRRKLPPARGPVKSRLSGKKGKGRTSREGTDGDDGVVDMTNLSPVQSPEKPAKKKQRKPSEVCPTQPPAPPTKDPAVDNWAPVLIKTLAEAVTALAAATSKDKKREEPKNGVEENEDPEYSMLLKMRKRAAVLNGINQDQGLVTPSALFAHQTNMMYEHRNLGVLYAGMLVNKFNAVDVPSEFALSKSAEAHKPPPAAAAGSGPGKRWSFCPYCTQSLQGLIDDNDAIGCFACGKRLGGLVPSA